MLKNVFNVFLVLLLVIMVSEEAERRVCVALLLETEKKK